MTYHERLKGQSKEIFRLVGGVHVRRTTGVGHPLYIRKDDTFHITRKEADAIGDKVELVELPVTADDITIDDDGAEETPSQALQAEMDADADADVAGRIVPSEPNTESVMGMGSSGNSEVGMVDEAETSEADTVDEETSEAETVVEETNAESVTADPPLTREDFSSDPAWNAYVEADYPDLSSVPKTGHSGSTYSAKDVRGSLS